MGVALPAVAMDEGMIVPTPIGPLVSGSADDGMASVVPFTDSSPCTAIPTTGAICPECSLPEWCKPKKMNFDSIDQESQFAWSIGFPVGPFARRAYATNDFTVEKQQLACPCDCSLYNIEQIHSGIQYAVAFGAATSDNNINIKTCQQ